MRQPLRMLLVLAFCFIASSTAAAATLYDATLGTLPTAQGWAYSENMSGTTQTAGGGVTAFDTTANALIMAGYAWPPSLVFDRNAGYAIAFDVRVTAESHSSTDRAGFSLISLDKDMKGIELGFWQDHIWAQNYATGALFTHGEDAAYNTAAAITRYTLSVDSANYYLRAGSDPTPILSGPLRDYTASGLPPYNTPNMQIGRASCRERV